tara:strand:- start:314 stop:2887 length:2574 start_codon:yes stop_codon:yes gene_type:complete
MSFFGLNESEQKNITENSISNSVRNSSSNISRNTIASSQDTTSTVEVDIIDSTILCPYDISSVAKSVMNQDVQVLSETHTSYDTNLTNNVTNTLKNEVKQKTPGLFEAGLFSSQVNNQLNKSVNSTKNNVSNNFYKNRKNLVSSDQSTTANVKLNINRSTIKCSKGDRNVIESNATSFLQNNFLAQSLDEESATTSISTTFSNNLSNVASQTGGSILGIVALFIGAIALYIFSKKKNGKGESEGEGEMSLLKKKFLALFGFVVYISGVAYILTDPDSFKKDGESPECDSGYKLSDSFSNDQDKKDKCAEKINKLNSWKKLRSLDNFSSTDASAEVSGSGQYPRVSNSISHRGVHREMNGGGTFFDVDYTRLNIDPYSDYDCGEEGGIPGICRTLKEDFEWEELIHQSCGCCGCDPENIGYMKEWLDHNPTKRCALDNSRKFGEFCDKNIDIIQPGSGYETGQGYNTTCRNPKNDSRPGAGDGLCKKRNADGTLSDILDTDLESSIVVSLISETDCVGLSSDLMRDPIACNHGDDRAEDDVKTNTDYTNMGCCYKEAPEGSAWSTVTDSLFGEVKNTGERCAGGHAITTGEAATAGAALGPVGGAAAGALVDLIGGICPENCTKADSCRITYLQALKDESDRANRLTRGGTPTDMDSQASHCTEGCEYKIMGVQELRVTGVPDNHIEDPDNVYTIVNKSPILEHRDMKPVVYNKDGGLQNPELDSIWEASSFIHFTNRQEVYDENGFDKPNDCSGIASNISFSRAELTSPNLCECKFRRLPSCIKNAIDKSYKTTMGCPTDKEGNLNADTDCMVCELEDGSGVKRSVKYGDKLKDISFSILIVWTILYMVANLLLLYI